MLSVYRLVSLAFIALSLFQVVDAYSARTNGQRLARGLPPARPKRLYVGARNNMARGDPSAIPTSATETDTTLPSSDPIVPSTSVSVPSSTPVDASSIPSSSTIDTSSSVDIPTDTPSSTLPTSSPSDTPTSTPVDTPTSTPSSTPVDTPTSTPPSSTPSTPTSTLPAPGSTQTGVVGVYSTQSSVATRKKRDSGTLIGYVGAYGIVQSPTSSDASSGWEYSYVVPDPLDAVVELSHIGTPYHLSGVAIRSGPSVTLGPGNLYYLELAQTRAHTAAGSPTATYVYDTYAIGYAQTTIFIIDSVTGEITVRWVNPDGSLPKTYIVQSGTILYVTGDVAALQRSLGTTDTTIVQIYMDLLS